MLGEFPRIGECGESKLALTNANSACRTRFPLITVDSALVATINPPTWYASFLLIVVSLFHTDKKPLTRPTAPWPIYFSGDMPLVSWGSSTLYVSLLHCVCFLILSTKTHIRKNIVFYRHPVTRAQANPRPKVNSFKYVLVDSCSSHSLHIDPMMVHFKYRDCRVAHT